MSKVELKKHTLFLYEGDYARLQSYYAEVGAAVVIRKIVRKHLDALDTEARSGEENTAEIEKLFQE